ncbi:TPA: IS21-like element helper ATPase IstB [Enterococcus faecium]|jgi:DNA replication protein DnaC|uniref:IS putative ATP-binding protein n=3 Tax=Bacilli TaxID=91061 RepID=E3UT51_ENTFC|nr:MULTISPECIES: IS21-like element helper ATPase IstB [Lactobacillales]ELA64084.1 hypothetical protein OGK_04987 [Enterococcus faecium EnGen0019]ELA83071.1 hypothetical protein OI3_04984 [Enterococcus faecium EnGen0021]ELA89639.1 hypothetical protein OI7_05225 [Enterococcus faecium EnGen0020]EOF56173.1 hypothetical protein SE3_02225 [Enterococcus faecium EnGen0124]EOF63840.1 hypothetical protein SEG_02219 [Enterococcus faecium EnGen0135]EOF68303.1 hypothetical protein SEU_02059 [Enterococcus 
MMLNEQTEVKLAELKLSGMLESYREQMTNKEYQSMSFEDRFNLMVDLEHSRRKNNKLQRLIKSANFRNASASIEDIEYHPDRNLDKNLILKLASGTYLEEHHNIILMGASGNGKTYIANAFGIQACRQYYNVKYIRLPELLDELTISKNQADGSFRKIINRYKKVQLLIIDEWLLTNLSLENSTFLLEIIESRLKTASTIFCSQFHPEGWHEKLGNPQIADAILDRIIHDSYQILVDGKVSMRERYGIRN